MIDGPRTLFDVDEQETGLARIAELREVLNGERPPAPSPDEQRAEREAAIDQVEANNSGWINDTALPFLRGYLEQHPTLFTEDLWAAGMPAHHEPKALGAAIRVAAQRGWIEKTGQTRISSQNANPKPIWRSLLCGRSTEEDTDV